MLECFDIVDKHSYNTAGFSTKQHSVQQQHTRLNDYLTIAYPQTSVL